MARGGRQGRVVARQPGRHGPLRHLDRLRLREQRRLHFRAAAAAELELKRVAEAGAEDAGDGRDLAGQLALKHDHRHQAGDQPHRGGEHHDVGARVAVAELLQLHVARAKLREALYFRSETTEAQGEIDGVDQVLPNKRFAQLQPLAWDLELTGCKVVVDYGLGDDVSNVELCDCKVNQFRIDPKEGGTVELTFRVQTSNLPTGALDKLSTKLGHETQIVLTRPEVKPEPQQQAIDGTKESYEADQARRSGKGKGATDAFVAAHGEAASA